MMRIALLYICTGAYDIFWKDFYSSAERYFISDAERHYYVFTDSHKIEGSERVHIRFQEPLAWPYPTLYRFKIFNTIADELKHFDYVFFTNANLLFKKEIGTEILPVDEGLCVTLHPGYYSETDPLKLPLERNPDSLAYVGFNEGRHYFMGGFNGGRGADFMAMSRQLETNIDRDERNGIIAVWHDESHLNKYLLNRHPKILDPSFGYPDGWDLPFEPSVIIRDKNHFGGHDRLRNLAPAGREVKLRRNILDGMARLAKKTIKVAIKILRR